MRIETATVISTPRNRPILSAASRERFGAEIARDVVNRSASNASSACESFSCVWIPYFDF